MSCGDFSDTVMGHFINPRNCGTLPDANCEGPCDDPDCGDNLTFYLKILNERIIDIRFLMFGCTVAIATSSMLTVFAKEMTMDEAMYVSEHDIANSLGG